MSDRSFIFDYEDQKAKMFRFGNCLYDLQTEKALFKIENDWAICLETGGRAFWIHDRYMYRYLGGSSLSVQPVMYHGQQGPVRPIYERPVSRLNSAETKVGLITQFRIASGTALKRIVVDFRFWSLRKTCSVASILMLGIKRSARRLRMPS